MSPAHPVLLHRRLLLIFSVVTVFFMLLLFTLLPHRLYKRDLQNARREARAVSELVRAGLLSTMINTGDAQRIRQLIQEFQQQHSFEFRMVRSAHVEQQHGVRSDEQATDLLLQQTLETGRSREDWVDRTTFRLMTPLVSDTRCGTCHLTTGGEPVPSGIVLGVSELIFDLAEAEADSLRLILEVLALLVFALVSMGWVCYVIVTKGILERIDWVRRPEER
jgi:hypothetical protein